MQHVKPQIDPQTCWEALIDDTTAAVAVLDQRGRVLYANSVARRVLGDDSPIGRTLHELFSKDLADERISLISRAITDGEPVTYDSMIRGVAFRTVLRPMTDRDGSTVALLVARPAAGSDTSQSGDSPRHVVRATVNDAGPLKSLTRREFEVLGMIGEGLSTAAIAQRLGRSVKTVEGHRVALGSKLVVGNRVELARIAIRAGLCRFDAAVHDPIPRVQYANGA